MPTFAAVTAYSYRRGLGAGPDVEGIIGATDGNVRVVVRDVGQMLARAAGRGQDEATDPARPGRIGANATVTKLILSSSATMPTSASDIVADVEA